MIRGMIYLVLLVVVVGLVGFFLFDRDLPLNDEVKSGLDLQDNNPSSQESEVINDNNNLGSQTSSDGGGGAGGGGGTTQEIDGCISDPISYSLRNFDWDINCIEYNQTTCTKVSVKCKVNVFNLDDVTSGYFKIEMVLMDLNNDTRVGYSTVRRSISPGASDLFESSFSFSNPNGVSERYRCKFDSLEVPKKYYCN